MSAEADKRRRIALAGAYGENNAGDDILLLALLRGLRERCGAGRLTVFTANRANTEALLVREGVSLASVRTIYSGRWGLFEPGRRFPRSLSWIPGTVFSLLRSRLFLIGPGNPIKDDTNKFKLLFHLSRAVISFLVRTPYAFVGIAVGRVTWKVSRRLFEMFGNRAAFVSTRDPESAAALPGLGIKRPRIVALADLSFCEAGPGPAAKDQDDPKALSIGLNVRAFSAKHYPVNILESYHQAVLAWCRWVAAACGGRLAFFPFCEAEHQSDLPAYERLAADLDKDSVRIEKRSFWTLAGLRSQIAECDMFLGTRFHSVLLAVQESVPTLALSYGGNALRFMKMIGKEEFVIRVEDLDFEGLRRRWERLSERRAEVRIALSAATERQAKRAFKHFDLISAALDGSLRQSRPK
jgi:polysaccharide pyruvyl transferase WcaK-like protein